MTRAPTMPLLSAADPLPYHILPAREESPFVMISDHAGQAVPSSLRDMGVPPQAWERHIAYDIGIKEVGRHLQNALGCLLIEQVYSRLVIDCNRAAGHPTSIPPVSDGTAIAGNQNLSQQERYAREEEILHAYHDEIERHLAQRDKGEFLFVSLHSFTPAMEGGEPRPWEIGLLHDHDPHSARLMRTLLEAEGGLCVGDNQPYVLNSHNEYSVPYHAGRRQLPALEIEIRQDLISDDAGQRAWAERLARLLPLLWAQRKERA
ncbi:N-formylglutamate amidohydrolase [Bombella sp. TMW 2.2556]|uniref:N-formylglutamate amidohydrolase n=2 Tax=Bombella pollinis TaxID=2967337 RepID=A0ABT3WJR2_9PROT|nr:N-formylglutamate amidohydrolase [Bombella pollinis]MCX5619296.1 N-formylglutamate amidohydrolase [Bombella pollinis]